METKFQKKPGWPRREDPPCCEKVFISVDVWTEAEQWNVGMKFWNEGTMKNGWVGAARVRKVEKKKGTARGSGDQKAGNWGRGKTERQIGLNSELIAPKRSPDRV